MYCTGWKQLVSTDRLQVIFFGIHPTLTQVPPERPFSMSKVLAPYHPDALLAAPEPPLPPPMTMKSYWVVIGAMLWDVLERCLDTPVNRERASLEAVGWQDRRRLCISV